MVSSYWSEHVGISGSFLAGMMAIALLDPASAFLIAAIAEAAAWVVERYRLQVLPINIAGSAVPTLALATVFAQLDPRDGSFEFFLLLGAAAWVLLALNMLIVAGLVRVLDGGPFGTVVRDFRHLLPGIAINVVLTVATAEIYLQVGLAGVLFMFVAILAFTYMARLVVLAQERTRQYASLSWGVLSGLLRTLEQRDARSARHAAAVAAFSRDIAQEVGLSKEDQELAHTAGLLHDIGGFGLSDRVMERGQTLTEQDWQAIRRHPELGADLLRDLGTYGPVAEIVRAHHERVDGRGYPYGLPAEEIPELAKVVSVAEVYDTLTSEHTYRTPVSSFEALRELRRVSGSQLEGRYVEALSSLLAGRGTEYRHADTADYVEELDLERRINEAVDRAMPAIAGTGTEGPAPSE